MNSLYVVFGLIGIQPHIVASVMRKWADLKEKGLVEKYKSRDVFWV